MYWEIHLEMFSTLRRIDLSNYLYELAKTDVLGLIVFIEMRILIDISKKNEKRISHIRKIRKRC